MTPGISQESSTAAPRANNDWLSHTLSLIGWNVKLARRRLMSKILLAILLAGFLLVMGFLLLSVVVLTSYSTSSVSVACPTPAATAEPGSTPPGCDPVAQQQQQQELQQAKDEELKLLTFPTVLSPTEGYTGFMGIILLCILAGAVIGGEYSFGTQRLALSRGVSRAQVLAGQVGMLALLALMIAGGMLILGILTGFTVGPLLGASLPAFPADGVLQLLGFWLVLSLHLFAYTLVALLLATLGRSTAAGIGGALGYVIFELIALPIVTAIAYLVLTTGSAFGDVLQHIQDAFLAPNLSALLSAVNQSPLDLGGAAANNTEGVSGPGVYVISPLQGLLVTLLYCVVLIGLSYWVLRKRDVTN